MQQALVMLAVCLCMVQIVCFGLGLIFKDRRDLLSISANLGPVVVLLTLASLLFRVIS